MLPSQWTAAAEPSTTCSLNDCGERKSTRKSTYGTIPLADRPRSHWGGTSTFTETSGRRLSNEWGPPRAATVEMLETTQHTILLLEVASQSGDIHAEALLSPAAAAASQAAAHPGGLSLKSLSTTRLINHLACPSLGDAELSLELRDCRSPSARAYQFPSERCLSLWMSKVWSATKVLNRLFSSPRCFSRFASSHFIPPPTTAPRRCPARQRSGVDSLISKACNTAARFLPALSITSAYRNFGAISSGRCFFRRLYVIESLLALWAVDLHFYWTRISKAGHEDSLKD